MDVRFCSFVKQSNVLTQSCGYWYTFLRIALVKEGDEAGQNEAILAVAQSIGRVDGTGINSVEC
ncbi:MAG: hypothetical protein K0S45_2470 [Nitrospira sp.]|jgi:hypothetical protein|nr:hypothetical protein [Nitrospira sp.]